MYYNQSTVKGKQTYQQTPKESLGERTKKLYKLLKQNKLFGIYMTTVTVRPKCIYDIIGEWLWMPVTPIYDLMEKYYGDFIEEGTMKVNRRELLEKFNDTLSRLDDKYLVNLIKYMRRYFNSERGRNIKLI